jgi:hypothetical protein
VRVDGEKMNKALYNEIGVLTVADTKKAVYVDTYGNVVAVDEVPDAETEEEPEATYVYVIDRIATAIKTKTSGLSGDSVTITTPATAQARVIDLATGEIKTVNESIKLNAAGTNYIYVGYDATATTQVENGAVVDLASSTANTGIGTIMKYTVSEDGSYALYPVANVAITLTKGNTAPTVNHTGDVVTEKTTLTTVDVTTKDHVPASAKVTTVTGKANIEGTLTKAVVEVEDDTNRITRIFAVTLTEEATSSSLDYAIYLGAGETTSKGAEYKFVVDGEVVSYPVKAADNSSTLALLISENVGKPLKLTIASSDGTFTAEQAVTKVNDSLAVLAAESDYVVYGTKESNTTIEFASTCKIVDGTYDSAAGEDASNASYKDIALADGDTVTIYKNNSTSKATFIIVTAHKAAE